MQTCEVLYASAVEMARDPAFFADHGVADNVDGRFDALALVVSLVMRRLNSCGDAGAALSQELFDTMFADMDLSLREMGAGDIGVAKRVRVMAEAFMGRLDAYTAALDDADRKALAAALEHRPARNVVVSDSGNFPSDLYMADGLFRTMGASHELRIVDPDAVSDAIDESVADAFSVR